MYKSQKLINDLNKAGVKIKLCDEKKIQQIIRQYFCEIHKDAVEQTIMANNKIKFTEPQFND